MSSMSQNSNRIAIIDEDKCKPKNCKQECSKKCPVVAMGKLCIEVNSKKAIISETLCTGCNICTKQCPFNAIKIINLPSGNLGKVVHRYCLNGFKLYNLPTPKRGMILGLVGNNGIGKSTALKLLSGTGKKEEINKNAIIGEEINNNILSKYLPNLGILDRYVSLEEIMKFFRGSEIQQFYIDQLEYMNNKESINDIDSSPVVYKLQYIDELSKLSNKKVHDYKIDEKYLNLFDLLHLTNRNIENLSGGELQRFACAVACSKKSNLYLFDEPSSFLDIKQRINMSNAIRSLKTDNNYIICVEHDLAILDYLSDYVCLFYGAENAYGIVTEAMNNTDGINIYLNGFIPTENVRFRNY